MNTVSICMITYGHENYIKQAIEGVLIQETSFELELIIANDSSPDNSHLIIQEIIKNHPRGNIISYTNHDKNLGIIPNLLFAINQCKGKYVAMCEGDDYWVTSDKLQKQVDMLEQNNEIGLVYTGVKFFEQKSNKFVFVPSKYPEKKDNAVSMMLNSKFVEFPTTIFRKNILDKVISNIKPELDNAIIGDTRILLETFYLTDFYFLEEVTTVYRVAEGSASYPKNIDKYIFMLLDTFKCRQQFVERNNMDKKLLSNAYFNLNKALVNKAFTSNNYLKALKLIRSINVSGFFNYINWKSISIKKLLTVFIKLIATLLGVGVIKQRITKKQ